MWLLRRGILWNTQYFEDVFQQFYVPSSIIVRDTHVHIVM